MQNRVRKFVAQKQNGALDIFLYDVIGADLFGQGITPKGIAEILDSNQFDSINLRINSPGGNLFDAVAIVNLLKSKNVPITSYIDGEAASAATIIMLAGKSIVMGEGSMLFIHNAMSMEFGNAAQMRKTADDLEKISGEMAKMYATRTGMSEEAVQAIMDKETFLTADEAVAMKFADEKSATQPAVSAYLPSQLENDLLGY